ncbi:MAG: Uma2 family endonuclease [Cyanobacteria bacterium J06639_1]
MLQLDLTTPPNIDDLPGSDETPVDNEDQNFVPNVLLFVLEYLWRTREDWYFGVDMALYYPSDKGKTLSIVPDGFLSVGVKRRKDGKSRKSYFTWKEQVIPQFVLEVVSETKGGEYDDKLSIYQSLGVKYYVIYNPTFWQRDRHEPLEIYKLESDRYQLQQGEPYGMPEIGLGLGRCTQSPDPYNREVLGWYDLNGEAYPTMHEQLVLATERAEAAERNEKLAEQRAARLAQFLRSQGFDPDNLPASD